VEFLVGEQERIRATIDDLMDIVLTHGRVEEVLHILSTLSVTVSDISIRRMQDGARREAETPCRC
jgi:hypothetical protein